MSAFKLEFERQVEENDYTAFLEKKLREARAAATIYVARDAMGTYIFDKEPILDDEGDFNPVDSYQQLGFDGNWFETPELGTFNMISLWGNGKK